ncbi:MAG: hypothetical protein LC635_03080 [Pseudonocardiaceae bacterium]|nr:hypothetical protein [Pseudonocardiaceae bacterium]
MSTHDDDPPRTSPARAEDADDADDEVGVGTDGSLTSEPDTTREDRPGVGTDGSLYTREDDDRARE